MKYQLQDLDFLLFMVLGVDQIWLWFLQNILEDKSIHIYNFGKMKRDLLILMISLNLFLDVVLNQLHLIKILIFIILILQNLCLTEYLMLAIQPIELFSLSLFLRKSLAKVLKNFKANPKSGCWGYTCRMFKIRKWVNFKPQTSLEIGIDNFIKWYKRYYFKDKLCQF